MRHTLAYATCVPLLVLVALSGAARGQGSARVEAYVGQPFGVARISLSLPPSAATLPRPQAFVEEEAGRVLYPVVSTASLQGALGGILADRPVLGAIARELPTTVNVHFLFQGVEPLRITIYAPTPYSFVVTPRAAPPGDDRLLRAWWQQYSLAAREQTQQSDYPPLVETYLTNTLARRLGLDAAWTRLEPRSETRLQRTADLLLGVEALRRDIMVETLRAAAPPEEATLPPPDDIAWPAVAPPPAPAEVDIEPIAFRVPEECFYLRFGDISNFLWLRHLTEEHGGALSRLIALRGHDSRAMERVERRLAVRYSMLLDLLGAHVVDDLAIFGRDTYLQDGAAIGVAIKAKNAFLVATALNSERNNVLMRERDNGAASATLVIAGRNVSLLSTPDHRVRSYLARDGEYLLVSTSQALVERFFEASDGQRALGASADFRYARSLLPTRRNDAIFAYFSPAFFRGLVEPHYQIELRRRLRAVTDLELVALARRAAQAEGRPAATVAELIQSGLLPAGFARRPDGSQVVIEGDRVRDSLRGERGNFLPIPDTPLISVTPSEARQFARDAEGWAQQWRQMDPLAVGIQRSPRGDDDVEELTIDAYISPFVEEKYGPLLTALGPPTTQALAPVEGNLLSAEVSLQGGQVSAGVPAHLLFVGVQDRPRLGLQGWPGIIKPIAFLRTIPGYLGAVPKPGFVDLLPLGLSPPPDREGYSSLPLGVWRRQVGDFSVLAFDRQVLARATPQLAVTNDAPLAQARVHLGDLVAARHATWINEFFYQRAKAASDGNLRLLHALTQQLRVPPAAALDEAQRLLDVELICPLGGKHQLSATAPPRWITTASASSADYRPPVVGWLRGADVRLTKADGQVALHAVVAMQRKPGAPALKLPSLPFFSKP